MISYDEALATVTAAARPLGREKVTLAAAHGRVLAEPVLAAIGSPRADVSVMDGYAVREADLHAPLVVVGQAFPGAGFDGVLEPGQCVRIFTGAPVPARADRVVVQEIAHREGDRVSLSEPPGPLRFIRRRGSDFATGDALLPTGRRLDARALVAASAADQDHVTVWRHPRLYILATGDELVEPGTAWTDAATVPDSISHAIAAMAGEHGARLVGRRLLPDDPATIGAAAEAALAEADLVVVTGGASVGEKDHAKDVFAALGLDLLFSKVAMKPGRPVWLGSAGQTLAGQTLVLGLPGNPTSALVTARLLMAPMLDGMGGGGRMESLRWRSARLAAPIPACGDRETFVRGRWSDGQVMPASNQDSGAQAVLAASDLLIRQPVHSPARAAGETVRVIDF